MTDSSHPAEQTTFEPVDPNIGDLFFTRNLEAAMQRDAEGNPDGSYDFNALVTQAEAMLESLAALGLKQLPTPADLLHDFRMRL